MSGPSHGHGKESVRLCQQIVRQAFGNIVCRVATVLLNRGRLPLPILTRLAGLPLKTVSAALLLLMQHHLVQTTNLSLYYGSAFDDPSSSKGHSSSDDQYEFNVLECLNRLKFARILALTSSWYGFESEDGKIAEEIIRLVIIYGKIKVEDVRHVLESEGDNMRSAAIQQTLVTLVRMRFLLPTSPKMQVVESELIRKEFNERKRDEGKSGSKLLSAAQTAELTHNATQLIFDQKLAAQSLDQILIKKKRIATSYAKKGKKTKILENTKEDEYDYDLEPSVYLRVNHDRYGILIRNELIVKAAQDRWNLGAGHILRAMLELAFEDPDATVSDKRSGDVFFNDILTRIQILAKRTDQSFMVNGNEKYTNGHGDTSAGRSVKDDLVNGIYGLRDKGTPEIVRQYLFLLAGEDQIPGPNALVFLTKLGASSNPQYRVNLEAICSKLKEALLGDLVRQKLGDKGGRVLAVVAKANVASEQTVRDCAMLSLKDSRILLAKLQRLALVETTEVPKTGFKGKINTAPLAGADYHLWSVDLSRIYNNLLTSVYKSMANIIERRASEIEKRANVIEKDMKIRKELGEDGRGRLNPKDQHEIVELEQWIKKLTLGLERSDVVAFILRDLPGWPQKGLT